MSIGSIGAIVRQGRIRNGWSEAQLARKADVPLEIVDALESGRIGITRSQLEAVAHALALEPRALAQGREVVRPQPSVFLRHRGLQDFHDEDLVVIDEALQQGRILRELGEVLGDPRVTWTGQQSDAPHDRSDAAAQAGYRLAIDLRRHVGEPARPFEDLRATVEEALGVAVLMRRLSVRGACAVTTGDAAAIVLDGDIRRLPRMGTIGDRPRVVPCAQRPR